MPRPSPDAARLAAAYRLGGRLAQWRGLPGDAPARGTGASLEFQERRPYVAGDDVRHLDWRALARTDQLFVRLHREEVLPRLDLLLDATASMKTDVTKARLAVDLAALLAAAARAEGYHVRLIALGSRSEVVPLERFDAEGSDLDGVATLKSTVREAAPLVRSGSLRILVSDFLSPHDACALVRPLAARAGALVLLRVLSRDDAEPIAGEARRLQDAETGDTLDVIVDTRAVTLYRERLGRLADALTTECRRAAATFATLVAGDSFDALCRDALVPAGVLAAR
jgi:uncharacterized protein (DUF58 family)